MALLNKQISSLVGGVSQQPDSTKFDSQSRLQENFLSSVAKGLLKRAPTTFIKNLGEISEDAFIKFIERDKNENYIMVIDNGSVRVFDIDGVEKTVNSPNGTSYLSLSGQDPKQSFATLTIADKTVIVNKTVTVDKDTNTTDARQPEALIVVKEGKYGKTYKVRLFDDNGVSVDTAGYTVPDGSNASHTALADTTYIASQLAASLSADVPANFQVVQEGNIIWLYTTDGADFEIATEDGFGDIAMYAIKDSVALFSDLPPKAPNGFKIKVAGETDGVISSSYVVEAKRNADTALQGISFPLVTWEESVDKNISLGFINSTMPHGLTREGDGTFTFDFIEYGDRTVGDEETAEDPSFVGDKINGIFFHANRLGFLSGESVSLSESGNIFNFYPTSIATLLAGDPVIFTVNSTKVSILRHAVPFNEQVILFSDKHQYILMSEGNVTNASISIQEATEFEINSNVSPLAVGNNIYFANNSGEYTEVREYYVADFAANKDAANVTAHIPSYINKNINWMVSADNARTIVMTSSEDISKMYVYQVMWNGEQKAQSAWHTFAFNGYEIIGGEFLGSMLYVMLRKSGATDVYLEKIDFSDTTIERGADFIIYLDNRIGSIDTTPVYTIGANTTTFYLPIEPDPDNFLIVDGKVGGGAYGNVVQNPVINGNQVTVEGDYSNTFLWMGNTYDSNYQFGSVFLKEGGNGGSVAVTAGRTQILKTLINYDNSAQFDVVVELEGRTEKTTSFYGRVKGGIASIFGKIALASGVFKAPVNGTNTKTKIYIKNNSHLPSNIQFAEFLIRYQNNTGQRAP